MADPSHAGGIVFRRDPDRIRYLLVKAKKQDDEWVLPKGHIEDGESPAETATREVLEESGVVADVVQRLGRLEFEGRRGWVSAEFFLMEFRAEGRPSSEGRGRVWVTQAEAERNLPYADTRRLLAKAQRIVEAL